MNIPIIVTTEATYPSAILYIVPETQPPAVTIPIPNKVPAMIVDIPTGKTCAEEGYSPGNGLGRIQLNIPTKPIEATPIAIRTPFIFCPEPNKNKSLNEDAKQKRDFCKVNPNAEAANQIAASEKLLFDIINNIGNSCSY